MGEDTGKNDNRMIFIFRYPEYCISYDPNSCEIVISTYSQNKLTLLLRSFLKKMN
jgi:hypothetical protein